MDKGAWQDTVHRVTKSQTQLEGLSMHTYMHQTSEHIYTQILPAIKGDIDDNTRKSEVL